MPGYRFVLEQAAFAAFARLAEEEGELAHSYFKLLAANPNSTGRGFHHDSTGRPNSRAYAALF